MAHITERARRARYAPEPYKPNRNVAPKGSKAPPVPLSPPLPASDAPSSGGGFVRDARSVANQARPGGIIGRTVELVGPLETAQGASYQAGARFRVTGREGGAWRLERAATEGRAGVVLRRVSSFLVRLAED